MHSPVSRHDLAVQIEQLAQRLRNAVAPTGAPGIITPPSSGLGPTLPDDPPDTFADTASAFHTLVEGIREGAAILAHDHTVLTCNRRLAEMLKVDSDRIMGHSLYEFIPPEEHSRLRSLLDAAPQEFQKFHLRLSGNNAFPVPVEIALSKLDVGGTPVYAFLATDLSRRRRAEEQLPFQARLLENVSDAVLAMDEHYRITYWNTAAERLYGWAADEVMGRTLSEVVQPQLTADEQRELDARLVETGAYDNESWQRRKDGTALLVESRRIVLRDPAGRMTGYVALHRDITDRARAQELARLHALEMQAHAREMARYAEQMKEFAAERQNRADILEQRVTERTAELQAANRELEEENVRRQAEIRAREQTEAKLRQVLQSLEDAMLSARESEELLRITIQAAGMVAWTYDPDKDEVRTFARTPDWLEILAEEKFPLFERGVQILHPDDRARVLDALPGALAGEPFNIEVRLVQTDGQARWIAARGQLMSGESGQPPLLVGVAQDISGRREAEDKLQKLNTAQKRAIATLQKRETTLRQAGQMAHLGAWDIEFSNQEDLDANPLTWSDEVYRIFGYAPREVPATNDLFFERVHPEDRPRVREAVAQALATHQPYSVEHRILQPDGTERIVHERGEIAFDAQGRPARLVGAVQDVTERKQAEEALRASEARYRRLVEVSPEGIALHAEGKIVFANDAAVRLVGAQHPDELIGRPMLGFVHPDFREIVLTRARESVEEGKAEPWVEEKFIRLDGQTIDVEVASIPSVFDGRPATQVVVRDITDRKHATEVITALNADLERRATDLEIAYRELESFSYSVSHDLRTPLASITSFSKLLQDDYGSQLSSEVQHYLGLIQSNGQQMDQLITSLLALSRLSQQPVRKQTVDMMALVRQVQETVQKEAQRSDLTIEGHDLPDALADPVLIKQVWVNLIANAVKFTRNRQDARIEIGCEACDGEDRVYFVRDNGVGFDMQQADKLFGVFQRLHGEEEYEGMGIGLAIVARIVRRHSGRVWAEGQVGQGATFYFTLK